MTHFHDLFRNRGRKPDNPFAPDRRSEYLPEVVAATPFRLWKPGEPITTVGRRLLLGVATWNGYDMALLDLIEDRVRAADPPPVRVDVFDTDTCLSLDAFQRYVPGVELGYQTPLVGYWVDGVLRESAWGYDGREIAIRVCGLDREASRHHILTVLERS